MSSARNSDSDTQQTLAPPVLKHTLHQEQSSVLSLATHRDWIFSGSQGQDIYVWDRKSFVLKTSLRGHTEGVLALELAPAKNWLFSSSGDRTVRIWSTVDLAPLYVINPYLEAEAGDLFSLAYSPVLDTLYIGCQNTSLQWINLSKPDVKSGSQTPPSGSLTPKWHRFFDSFPQAERKPPGEDSPNLTKTLLSLRRDSRPSVITRTTATLQITAQNTIDSAHFGYMYCMALTPSPLEVSDDEAREDGAIELVTGSGDETVKVWSCSEKGVTWVHTFSGCDGGVLSLVARNGTIYAGCQGGHVKVYDLDTRTLVRTIMMPDNSDILSLSMIDTDLYTSSASGWVRRWSAHCDCTSSWQAHEGIILSSVITHDESRSDGFILATGANDNAIRLWEIERSSVRPNVLTHLYVDDTLVRGLHDFVQFPSVSSLPENREDCRQAAIWLRKFLTQLGAEASLVPTQDGLNPLVLATFRGSEGKRKKSRILFYGHYDVIPAPKEGWDSDPFDAVGTNGYIYGRGVTDNKGPILAAACAASNLLRQRKLDLDLVMLIEGEEEAGSMGFAEAVKANKELIGTIDVVFISNSYWIGETTPCITYGLRGVVQANVEIRSHRPDLHSGVEGGAIQEPMLDMIRLLGTLSDSDKIRVPEFYDNVRPMQNEERELYELLSKVTQRPAASLASKWREPALSVHNISVSGPGNATVIPSSVKAQVSLRLVPDQNIEVVSQHLVDYMHQSFSKLNSCHTLDVSIERTADWWLGNLKSCWFKALEQAVLDEWGVRPLRIREGGSIPSIPFLEKELNCGALHLPMGQSSDQAHLPNERISLANLKKGKSVMERFLVAVSQFQD
ncbi:glutathione degradosome [Sistotremastrum niveocremeum HHB9708]|uniref:Glutathione degradosome n=1 Tax=Sistotremastrum niveocremeum HHB9708 TaxID=1314777 RepID=A0A164XMC1_9AGAM|nr:glutathione degradosome [Sistotremastrum niveocremeum HHB9708]